MKTILRISLLTMVIGVAFGGNVLSGTQVATLTPSSVPGGGGPMPTCNPFNNPTCKLIR